MRAKLILLPLVAAAALTAGSTVASAQRYFSDDPPGWRYQAEKQIEDNGYDPRGDWRYSGRRAYGGYSSYGYVPDGYAAYGYAPDAYVSFGFGGPGVRHRHWGW